MKISALPKHIGRLKEWPKRNQCLGLKTWHQARGQRKNLWGHRATFLAVLGVLRMPLSYQKKRLWQRVHQAPRVNPISSTTVHRMFSPGLGSTIGKIYGKDIHGVPSANFSLLPQAAAVHTAQLQ
jgi:hypothetical protein